MTDVFDTEKRSEIMSRVSGKDTKPEIFVRSTLHRMGYRFRLHVASLPGKPDIVLPRYKKVIFVNGCFWHGHTGCRRAKRPATNQDFWNEKIEKNIRRDTRNRRQLRRLGWSVMTLWQCGIKDSLSFKNKLARFIDNGRASA